jgi:hypothetical protein
MMGTSLCAPQPRVGASNRSGCSKYGTVALQHYERSLLVCKPLKGSQGYTPICADYYKAIEFMPYSWETRVSANSTNSVF